MDDGGETDRKLAQWQRTLQAKRQHMRKLQFEIAQLEQQISGLVASTDMSVHERIADAIYAAFSDRAPPS